MFDNDKILEKAILAGVHTGSVDILSDTTDETMAELKALTETAGIEAVGSVIQNRPSPDNATYFGDGKIEEIKPMIEELGANIIIFDDELTPVQVRNISEKLNIKVIDRTMLILDIFASRAITAEGKIQVELAQLKYLLPRLSGFGVVLSRLGGGIGTRGPGETKLETDRRHIRRRIAALTDELREVERHRDLLRGRRKKDEVSVVAIVGYTNAGKSTLLNRLTGADVLSEDKLFATLDPTVRGLTLSDNRQVRLVDTVGFIRKLPHHLIKAFKSTLEEVVYADILLHIIDASNPEYPSHMEVVESLLLELGAKNKPTIAVFNKVDQVESTNNLAGTVNVKERVDISAKLGMGIDDLLNKIEEIAPGKKRRITAIIPYSESKVAAMIHKDQVVLDEEFIGEGIKVTALVDFRCYDTIRRFIRNGE